METEGLAPAPVTAEEMVARWAARDAEYAKQPPLAPDAVAAIRHARMTEAGQLPDVKARARLWARAQAWAPPKSQDFGSLKDWLE